MLRCDVCGNPVHGGIDTVVTTVSGRVLCESCAMEASG